MTLIEQGVSPDDIVVYEDTYKGYNCCLKRGVNVIDNLFDFDMKFDLIVGNPPYTDTRSIKGPADGGTSSSLDSVFFERSIEMSPRVSLIIRSKHFAKSASKFRRNLFSSGCIESIRYLDESVFPSISMTETCVVTYDRRHNGTTKILYSDGISRDVLLDGDSCIRLTNPDYVPVVDNNIAYRHQRGNLDLNELIEGNCPMVTTMGGKSSSSPIMTYVDPSQHILGVGQHGVIMNDKYGGDTFGGVCIKNPDHSISGSTIILKTDSYDESERLHHYLTSDSVANIVKMNKISNVHSKELFKTIPDLDK